MTQTKLLPTAQVLQFPRSPAPKPRSQNHKSRATQAVAVITVNLILSAIAIVSLVKLWQFQDSQKSQLQDIEREVSSMESNVNVLKDKFSQAFDSGQSQSALLRQKGLISPTQRPIKFAP